MVAHQHRVPYWPGPNAAGTSGAVAAGRRQPRRGSLAGVAAVEHPNNRKKSPPLRISRGFELLRSLCGALRMGDDAWLTDRVSAGPSLVWDDRARRHERVEALVAAARTAYDNRELYRAFPGVTPFLVMR